MTRSLLLFTSLLISTILFVACDSNTALPTLQATAGSAPTNPTVDPNLGSGFDPNLDSDEGSSGSQPTPTRESGASVGSDTESGARGTGFTAQITGGSTANIEDGGRYACSLTGHLITSGDSPAPNIAFTFPSSKGVGTHSFVGADANGAVAGVVILSSVTDSYALVTGGTLTIDEIPEADGDFVSGDFDFMVKNTAGKEIGVRGSFDFETSNTAYC